MQTVRLVIMVMLQKGVQKGVVFNSLFHFMSFILLRLSGVKGYRNEEFVMQLPIQRVLFVTILRLCLI